MAVPYQFKRTTVAGRSPTTSDILSGQVAINLTDRKAFCSDGSSVFEVGANLSNIVIANNVNCKTITANGSIGTQGQLLTANGTGNYWSNIANVCSNTFSLSNYSASFVYSSNTTSAISQKQVDSFPLATYRSASYFIQISDGANTQFQTTNISLVHNGSVSFMTEYGVISTVSSLGIFDSDISAENVRLLFTPTTANTVIKMVRTNVSI